MNVLLAALALAVPAPVVVAPPPIVFPQGSAPATAVSSKASKLAQRLEELTEPRQVFVAANYATWEAAVRRTMSLNPSVAKLEQAYPGVTEAGVAAARPAGRAYCEEFVDALQATRVALYAQSLSVNELEQSIAFFETPAAQRVLRRMVANVDSSSLIEQTSQQVGAEGKVSVTAKQAARLDRAALQKTAEQTSAEDQVALMRFSQTPAGRAYAAAHTLGNSRLLELVNTPNPDRIKRQQEAIQSGMLAFIDRKKKP